MTTEELVDLVGTADSKISVSMGMSDKEYGNGFDAHVSVTLSCSQTKEDLTFAYDAARGIAEECLRDAFIKAKEIYNA